MNSTQLWRAVRREFKEQHPSGTIHRVENTLERGMPDVVWCAGWVTTGWIELKGEGDFEAPLQRAFRRKWNRAGGVATVLTAKQGKFILTEWDYHEEFDTLAEAIMCIVGGN